MWSIREKQSSLGAKIWSLRQGKKLEKEKRR